MTTNQRRVSRMIDQLAQVGAEFERDGDFVRIHGLPVDEWVKRWIERYRGLLIRELQRCERALLLYSGMA